MNMKNQAFALLPLLALSACVVNNHPPAPAPGAPAATTAAPAATTAAPAATTAAPPPATTAAPAAPPPQPGFEELPDPPQPPGEEAKGSAEGRPSGLRDGAPEGAWVWHDAAGWHLRTTTMKNPHRFRGRVWGMKGEVGNVKVVRTEHNDRFRKKGNHLYFDFTTNGHEDGFDFQLAESNCAFFHIGIDGANAPNRINIGAAGVHPRGAAFKVCQ